MKSISGKNWEEIFVNKRLIEKAKIDNNFNDIQAKLIVSRHFSKEEIYSINNLVQNCYKLFIECIKLNLSRIVYMNI